MVEPNAALAALVDLIEYDRAWGLSLVKVQPPDGLVVELVDGTRWCVSAHRCGP